MLHIVKGTGLEIYNPLKPGDVVFRRWKPSDVLWFQLTAFFFFSLREKKSFDLIFFFLSLFSFFDLRNQMLSCQAMEGREAEGERTRDSRGRDEIKRAAEPQIIIQTFIRSKIDCDLSPLFGREKCAASAKKKKIPSQLIEACCEH